MSDSPLVLSLSLALKSAGSGPWAKSHIVLVTRHLSDPLESAYVFIDTYRVDLVPPMGHFSESRSLQIECRWGGVDDLSCALA